HIWTPAQCKGSVVDIFFSITNRYRTETVVEGTRPFTQTVLRTDTTTDFRQGIGLMTQFSRLEQPAFRHQFQPVWNVVMYRTFPLTIRVTTTQTTMGLICCNFRCKRFINFHKLCFADIKLFFLWILACDIQKLKVIM